MRQREIEKRARGILETNGAKDSLAIARTIVDLVYRESNKRIEQANKLLVRGIEK